MKKIATIEWRGKGIRIIDQTLLPARLEFLQINDLAALKSAVRQLKVRGAPALGAAAAWGVYLGLKDSRARTYDQLKRELGKVSDFIGSSRPTARNLFWGLERMAACLQAHSREPVNRIKRALFAEAGRIVEEDRRSCRMIGAYGQALLKDGDRVLTVCNAGILATIDYGTALGAIYAAKERGKRIRVFACETRPLLQGARLTTWELRRMGVDVTLICDNMAASLMKQGKIDKVLAGADRIAANGDAANKIGTYNLAVLSAYHKIPFYIAAPLSTFDLSISSGRDIPIEQRPAGEVTGLYGSARIAAKGVKVYNPAFDLTDGKLIAAIITDRGILRPPYGKNIKKIFRRRKKRFSQ